MRQNTRNLCMVASDVLGSARMTPKMQSYHHGYYVIYFVFFEVRVRVFSIPLTCITDLACLLRRMKYCLEVIIFSVVQDACLTKGHMKTKT